MPPDPVPAPPQSNALTWILLVLVLAAIASVGYFAFVKTGRTADAGKVPIAVSLTASSPVATWETPSPSPAPSVSAPAEKP